MNYLRKNAKLVMVVMGVVCMITFVVGAALTDLAHNAQRRVEDRVRNPIVVTWAKGKVHAAELDSLRYRHRLAYEFLSTVIGTALQRGGKPIINGRPASLDQQFIEVGIPADNSEESAIQTLVLAEEARRMGVVVDQGAVKDFLRQISSPELKEGDWLEIATEIVADKNIAVSQLFEHLAYELKAQHVRMLALAGLYAQGVGPIVPPGEAFELFSRINRRYSIEAYPIDVQPLASGPYTMYEWPVTQPVVMQHFGKRAQPS
jgi:hypothetical protein